MPIVIPAASQPVISQPGAPPFATPDWTTYGPRPRPLGFGGYNGIPWGPGLDIQVQDGYKGLDETPDLVLNDQQRTLADGTWSAPAFAGPRSVTIPFVVLGTSEADLQNKLATLEMAWDTDNVYRQLWAFNGQRALWATVRNRAITQLQGGRNQRTALMQVQWYARDPYWYGYERQTIVSITALQGGMNFPMDFPMTFGTTTPGSGLIVNPGLPTPLKITIPGPTTHPFIGSDTLGLGLDLDILVQPGQWLDIDTDQRTVLLNGTAPRNDLVVGQSQFFGLVNGTNQLRFRSASGQSSESATVTWSPRWR